MGALVRSIDWKTTPLGALAEWPQSLRTTMSICLNSRFPIAVYWGPDFLMLYNEALIPMVGPNKHPQALGQSARVVLAEIWTIIEPLLTRVRATGEATWSEDLMLPLARTGAPEESYFTFTYSPIRDETEGVGGVFCAVVETTEKVIEGRRLRLFSDLAEAARSETPILACERAAAKLAAATADVPFALLYLVDDAGDGALVGAANIIAGSELAPVRLRARAGGPWRFEGIENEPRFVSTSEGPNGARGAVLLPIARAAGDRLFGFVVVGLSPVLSNSESYKRFHTLLGASISQAVNSAAAYERARERAEALAAIDRAKTAFFNNVSHEFRTPLTLMIGPLADMLAERPEADPRLAIAHRNSLRLLKLVNTLLEFSRIEVGRIEASYEPQTCRC